MTIEEDEIDASLKELDENAKSRKRRLMELKEQVLKKKAADGLSKETEEKSGVLFRSYQGTDALLLKDQVKISKDVIAINGPDKLLEDYIDESKEHTVREELETKEIVGHKVTDDLHRIIKPKLDILEHRLEVSIAKLIRQKIGEGKIDLNTAVNSGAATTYGDAEEDI